MFSQYVLQRLQTQISLEDEWSFGLSYMEERNKAYWNSYLKKFSVVFEQMSTSHFTNENKNVCNMFCIDSKKFFVLLQHTIAFC
jgi:hypothetical protein